jgi:hypothetical protein
MLALVLVFFVLSIATGLFINVYLYTHHALRPVHVRQEYVIDDQLFSHYADTNIADLW